MWTLDGTQVHHIRDGSLDEMAVKAVGDFDGNGFADILFMDLLNNRSYVWFNDGTLTPMGLIGNLPQPSPGLDSSLNVDAVGSGDFDGDGHADVLWTNLDTGSLFWWKIGSDMHVIQANVDHTSFTTLLGLADVNGDGVAEIIAKTASSVVWVNVRTGVAHVIAAKPAAEWRYSGAGSLASGKPCLYWFNRKTGKVVRWNLHKTDGTFDSQYELVTALSQHSQIIAY